ncbi:BtrH N-terminal domain-containing protein [Cohnella suwonensis]|uniref:BtrH N-terminal domain-containing protein n=1 Tax=Cohnella suwonensis TaxID=696072 RepID=A0ABW0LSV7_9BACL
MSRADLAAGKVRHSAEGVPRYFSPHAGDCFNNVYGAALSHLGLNPDIVLADYMNFMYDEGTRCIGINFLMRFSASNEFTEEELNSSMEFAYLPATSYFDRDGSESGGSRRCKDRVHIQLLLTDDPETAHLRLKERIDAGKPHIVAVDLHEMSYHRAFGREHGLHAVVVTGYDEETKVYELFDKYKHSSSDFDGELPMEEVRRGRSGICRYDNPLTGPFAREVRNMWMEVDADPAFRIEPDKLRNVFRASVRRMKGEEIVLGQPCGLRRIVRFRESVTETGARTPSEEEVYLFRHVYNRNLKLVSRQRKRFLVFAEAIGFLLPVPLLEGLRERLEESAMRWDICANLALKFGISRKADALEEMARQLILIEGLEREIAERLEAELELETESESVR